MSGERRVYYRDCRHIEFAGPGKDITEARCKAAERCPTCRKLIRRKHTHIYPNGCLKDCPDYKEISI